MFKYHVVLPLALFAVLVVAGVPVGAAFVVGMMAGCMSMMLMMARSGLQLFRHFTHASGAEDELARRLAAGAITEDEYRDRLATLRSTRTESGRSA
jgi:uncharacterized membrane protein